VPGAILCQTDVDTVSIPGPGHWVIGFPIDELCCVYEPYFAAIYIFTYIQGGFAAPVSEDDPDDTCRTYNDWGSGWIDLVQMPEPWPGEMLLWSKGYTQTVECGYWKPDTQPQAPSGMPDFGQYQFTYPESLAFCGPTAVANCLWWFNAVPPGVSPDSLIRLLSNYFHTDPDSGTYVDSIQLGLDQYFIDYGFDLYEHTYLQPDFHEMEDSLKRSQDIILLLGFWQEIEPDNWVRFGGHFVTMAGVCSESVWVAFSDPAQDAAENQQWPGRVRPGQHPAHTPGDAFHNDPQYVSHDIYWAVLGSPSPGGIWSLPDYHLAEVALFDAQNFQEDQEYVQYTPSLPVLAEVEYAIMICPKPTSVEEEQEGSATTPKDFELYQSYPNPFNNQTIIKYNLLKSCQVTLTIYNILGQKVKTLVNQRQETGSRSISWDGKDEKGKDLAGGIYFYQLKAGEVTQTKRMVLLK